MTKKIGKTNLVQQIFWSKTIFGTKDYFDHKKIGQQQFSPQKMSPKSLVKIESVTADILLLLTNVTRTYVAWTNVSVTVGICFRRIPLKVSSKLSQ